MKYAAPRGADHSFSACSYGPMSARCQSGIQQSAIAAQHCIPLYCRRWFIFGHIFEINRRISLVSIRIDQDVACATRAFKLPRRVGRNIM